MGRSRCPECKKRVPRRAKTCPRCGAEVPTRPPKWHERTSVTLCVAAVLATIALGFIHVIVGVEGPYNLPFDIVRRESFGYREVLVDAGKIRTLPYVAAKTRYPLGCQVLQLKGYLPSSPTFETQMVHELREAMDRWYAEFEVATGRTQLPWQDRLQEPAEAAGMQDAAAYNSRGVTCARQGRYGAALSEFAGAIRKNPAFVEAYYNRAMVYVALGNSGQAASDFSQVIEIRPESIDACIGRGLIHVTGERYDDAIADFTKAIEIDPTCVEAYVRRGMIRYAKGENEEAWEDIRKLQSLGVPAPSGFLLALRGESPEGTVSASRP
jgi:Flp pilus assembly protein TadD